MLQASELSKGSIIQWNPKLTTPQTTISPTIIVVTEILGDKIHYESLGVDRRSEPFEDDVMAEGSPMLSLKECEGVPLTNEVIGWLEFTKRGDGAYVYDHDGAVMVVDGQVVILQGDGLAPKAPGYRFLHELQAVVKTFTKQDLVISV